MNKCVLIFRTKDFASSKLFSNIEVNSIKISSSGMANLLKACIMNLK